MTHYVKVDGRFHHTAASKEAADTYVAQMTAGSEAGKTQFYIQTTKDGASPSNGFFVEASSREEAESEAEHMGLLSKEEKILVVRDAPLPAHSPDRFEVLPLEGHAIVRNGVIVDVVDTNEEATGQMAAVIARLAANKKEQRRLENVRLPNELPSEAVRKWATPQFKVEKLVDGALPKQAPRPPDPKPPPTPKPPPVKRR